MDLCGKILNQFHTPKKDLNLRKYFLTVLMEITSRTVVLKKSVYISIKNELDVIVTYAGESFYLN